jgi:mannose/fructose/N-acetylgalactosamine-specific phosphotransferase system component IIC
MPSQSNRQQKRKSEIKQLERIQESSLSLSSNMMIGNTFNTISHFYISNFNSILKDAKDNVRQGFGIFGNILVALSYVLVFLTFPISICCCLKVREQKKLKNLFKLFKKCFIIHS